MEFVSVTYFIWLIAFLLVIWISAHKYSAYIITIFGTAFVFSNAPVAVAILLSESILCYYVVHQPKLKSWIFPLLLIISVFSMFLISKYYAGLNSIVLPLGISYYTFRLIQYVQESHRKNIRKHTFIEFLAYMTFFPTYLVGPINLFPEFLVNIRRRKWNSAMFSKGLERMFYGYAQLIIVGNYIVNFIIKDWIDLLILDAGQFETLVLQSVHMWLDLYIRFSAYSSIAIGISTMSGFNVPENFNYPFFATNIKEFWQRWHMSLTNWCREYIFVPIAAVTRKPYLAIGLTMITIGIWHELSIRYILWGIYHSAGIIIYEKWSAFIAGKLPKSKLFDRVYTLFSILLTIIFVILSFPVTKIISDYINL